MNPNLDGKVALLTGGAAGIGLACAESLVAAGATVVLVGRDQGRLDKAVASLRASGENRAYGRVANVQNAHGLADLALAVYEEFGRIDVLVAAAGVLRGDQGMPHTLLQTETEEWDGIVDVNLTGVFNADRAVLPVMLKQRHGLIINVSSTSGRRGYAFDTAYCASKFGVIGLTEALAEECRPYGVRVHALLPGAIDTGMWDQNGPIPRPHDVLPVERVARVVVQLAVLADDTCVPEFTVEPLRVNEKPGWMKGAALRTDDCA